MYSSGTTYAIGNQVVYGMYKYESLQNSNTNHQPDLLASSTWWLKLDQIIVMRCLMVLYNKRVQKPQSFVPTLVIGNCS